MADDTGCLPFLAITAVAGAVGGAIIGGITAYKTDGNVWAGIGIGAATGALAGVGLGAAAGMILAGSATASTAAVVSGAGMLATAVSTGGTSAGVAYIANNLSSTSNNVAHTVCASANSMQQVVTKGKAGELAAGIVKNTQRIYISATKYRIPDGLDVINKTLSEVKNYSGVLSYSAQLRDYVAWSQANGYKMYLYTNASRLTQPLQQAVNGGLIELIRLNL